MKTFVEYLEARGKFHESLKSVGGFGLMGGWKPIGDESSEENKKNASYFGSVAKKIVVPKLYDVLERGSTDIHIYFGRKENMFLDRISLSKENNILRYENYFFEELGIPKTDIVYVKEMIGGDVWKPWIVLHGLSHAIIDSPHTKSKIKQFFDLIKDFYSKLCEVDLYNILIISGGESGDQFRQLENRRFLLSKIFRFRSAKTYDLDRHTFMSRNDLFAPVNSVEELIHEIFTWFLYNGENLPMPDKSTLKEIYDYLQSIDCDISEEKIESLISELFENLISMFKKNIADCRGHVVVD